MKYKNGEEIYYINKKKPLSVWDLPPGNIVVDEDNELYVIAEDGDWLEIEDSNGHIMYYNKKTNDSTWDKPEGVNPVKLLARRTILRNIPEPPPNTKNK